ncbi:hypothetical protein P7C70_g7592, partial [Phenoliferia sp. Uapishka_3]
MKRASAYLEYRRCFTTPLRRIESLTASEIAQVVVARPSFRLHLQRYPSHFKLRLLHPPSLPDLPDLAAQSSAIILYVSTTTSSAAQANSYCSALVERMKGHLSNHLSIFSVDTRRHESPPSSPDTPHFFPDGSNMATTGHSLITLPPSSASTIPTKDSAPSQPPSHFQGKRQRHRRNSTLGRVGGAKPISLGRIGLLFIACFAGTYFAIFLFSKRHVSPPAVKVHKVIWYAAPSPNVGNDLVPREPGASNGLYEEDRRWGKEIPYHGGQKVEEKLEHIAMDNDIVRSPAYNQGHVARRPKRSRNGAPTGPNRTNPTADGSEDESQVISPQIQKAVSEAATA